MHFLSVPILTIIIIASQIPNLMKLKFTLPCLMLLVSSTLLQAQQSSSQTTTTYGLPKPKDYDRWSVGVALGLTHLEGDLLNGSPNNNRLLEQAEVNFGYGLQVHRQLSHSIGLRVRGYISKFTGRDHDFLDTLGNIYDPGVNPPSTTSSSKYKDTPERYQSPLMEGILDMTYNFGNISFLDRNKNFHFIATLGIGVFNFNGKVYADTFPERLLRTSGNITELMIPMSLGFKYKISKVDVGLAFEYHRTFSDMVDVTRRSLSEYDHYIMLNLGINYTFGKKNKPMEWVNPMQIVYNDLNDMKEKIDVLSGDKDNDGVGDLFDKDNSTPEGTKVYGDGTAVDTDGDGIPDSKDADPFTAKGAKVDANGKESDIDADGVADSKDLEPNTEPGALVNFQGVTIPVGASGGNGVNGNNGNNGTGYLPSLFFDLGSAMIKPVYYDRILVIAKVLKTNPSLKLRISGNCDIRGNEALNKKLGQKRADAIKKHLVEQYAVDASRITTETKGKEDPAANKLNAMNRRVDFSIE